MTTPPTPASEPAVLHTTPLHAVHRRLGAQFTEFAGWDMPVRYASEVAEHHAVRTAAGLFDLSHMGEIEVTGAGAAAALDYALVGKPSVLEAGQARYSMVCDEHGGILDDLVVYRLAAERYLVVANAGNVGTVLAVLTERATGHGAKVHDATTDWALVAVQGPASKEILASTTDADLDTVKYYTIIRARVLGAEVLLARTGYTGEDGFEVYCRPPDAERLWDGLTQVGAPHGLRPAGLACRDTLRLEAGMPLYGHELGTDTTPFEVGLGRVVNFTKVHGFVGQEALAARRAERARQVLVGLVSQGRRSPRSGYPVLDPRTGGEIGHITSGAPSPSLGHPIAIASVPVRFQEPGTELMVDVRGTREAVRVVALPFYRRTT